MGEDVHVDLDACTVHDLHDRGNIGGTMGTILVEIRAAEGGLDAKLLVTEQYRIYQRWMTLEHL